MRLLKTILHLGLHGSVEDSTIPSPITTSSEKIIDTLESDINQEFESSSSPGTMEEEIAEIAEEQAILNGDPCM